MAKQGMKNSLNRGHSNPIYSRYIYQPVTHEKRLKENLYYCVQDCRTKDYVFISQNEGDCYKFIQNHPFVLGHLGWRVLRFYSEDDLLDTAMDFTESDVDPEIGFTDSDSSNVGPLETDTVLLGR